MKKLGLIILTLFVLTACQANDKNKDTLNVVTSFYPIYDFTSKVGGEKVSVHNVLPNGQDPHSFEPTTKDMAAIESADIFIYHGAGLESWVDSVLKQIKGKDIIIVEISQAVNLMESDHSHDHDHAEEEHNEAEDTDHDGHDYGIYDPHTWLSPVNALKETEMIKEALIQADPENEATYTANFEDVKSKFEALDNEFKDMADNISTDTFMVDHEAYGYLASEYHLHQRGIFENILSEEPTAKELEAMITSIKSENINAIFINPFGTKKVVDVIKKETGVTSYPLYTLESITSDAKDEDYFSLMRKNLESLKEGLGYNANH